MKKIIIKVDPQARVTIETIGYTGRACQTATKDFEKGHAVLKDSPTSDMYRNQIQGTISQENNQ